MASTEQNQCGNDRRSMTISVTLLGLTLSAVFFAYFTFSATNNVNVIDASTMEFATIVFRHGERAPNGLYPNDPHHNFSWIGGFGALTLRGSLQAYNLGVRLRERYRTLLPKNGFYSTKDMYVMSSATERCLMTAQSFLAGFLPPNDDDKHSLLPIKWQPVAINSVPREYDRLISQKAICKKYDDMLSKMYTDPPENLRKFLIAHSELFAYISKYTGANITTTAQGEHLYNILFIENVIGLELPKWTEAVFPKNLLALAERNLALLTENDFMKRVRGGYLVTDVLDKMIQIRNNQLKSTRRLYIYSGHDVTLVNVMRALNIISQTSSKPEFASAIHFELHRNPAFDNDFEVKIYYGFDHKSDLKPIKIPNCDAPCSLTTFEKSVESVIIRDYEQTCSI